MGIIRNEGRVCIPWHQSKRDRRSYQLQIKKFKTSSAISMGIINGFRRQNHNLLWQSYHVTIIFRSKVLGYSFRDLSSIPIRWLCLHRVVWWKLWNYYYIEKWNARTRTSVWIQSFRQSLQQYRDFHKIQFWKSQKANVE